MKSHAASRLHNGALMRSLAACAAVVGLIGLFASPAHAQPTSGQCVGMNGTMFTGLVGLAVPDSNNNLSTVQAASVPTVFGFAECDCSPAPPQQINLEIKVTTTLTSAPATGVHVWVGQNCDSSATRTVGSPPNCQEITANVPSVDQFISTTSTSDTGIHIPIPGNILYQPGTNTCDTSAHNNSIYVFLGDLNSPWATCYLSLSERNTPPTAVTGISAQGGDSSVALQWTTPASSSTGPQGYQVLCVDDCGGKVFENPIAARYSVCIGKTLKRRSINTGGTLSGLDGGTATTTDMSTASRSGGSFEVHPYALPDCPAPSDGGVADMALATTDLENMDPTFLCGEVTSATASGTRIAGLKNGHPYHFIVVSYDAYGNAGPSSVVSATPEPTEDLYRRFRDDGGPAGHCFIATAAFGSYESGWVKVLRDFRDETLLPTALGRDFVDWYYAHSPRAAAWIATRGWARALVRLALLPFIAGAFFWVYFALWQKALTLLLVAAFVRRKQLMAAFAHGKTA